MAPSSMAAAVWHTCDKGTVVSRQGGENNGAPAQPTVSWQMCWLPLPRSGRILRAHATGAGGYSLCWGLGRSRNSVVPQRGGFKEEKELEERQSPVLGMQCMGTTMGWASASHFGI